MVFESGILEATIAAAAGDDPALFAELRAGFVESVARRWTCCRARVATEIGMSRRCG
jgi:hypothetical protein